MKTPLCNPHILLPIVTVLALSACDGAPGPDLASAGLTTGSPEALAPPEHGFDPVWITLYPGTDLNRSIRFNRIVEGPGGDFFGVHGGVHVVLTVSDDDDGFSVVGRANSQGLHVYTPDGTTILRVNGSDDVDVHVAGTERSEEELRYSVVTPGPEPNYWLYLTLGFEVSHDGRGVMMAILDGRVEER